jgi:hypothetical protein
MGSFHQAKLRTASLTAAILLAAVLAGREAAHAAILVAPLSPAGTVLVAPVSVGSSVFTPTVVSPYVSPIYEPGAVYAPAPVSYPVAYYANPADALLLPAAAAAVTALQGGNPLNGFAVGLAAELAPPQYAYPYAPVAYTAPYGAYPYAPIAYTAPAFAYVPASGYAPAAYAYSAPVCPPAYLFAPPLTSCVPAAPAYVSAAAYPMFAPADYFAGLALAPSPVVAPLIVGSVSGPAVVTVVPQVVQTAGVTRVFRSISVQRTVIARTIVGQRLAVRPLPASLRPIRPTVIAGTRPNAALFRRFPAPTTFRPPARTTAFRPAPRTFRPAPRTFAFRPAPRTFAFRPGPRTWAPRPMTRTVAFHPTRVSAFHASPGRVGSGGHMRSR